MNVANTQEVMAIVFSAALIVSVFWFVVFLIIVYKCQNRFLHMELYYQKTVESWHIYYESSNQHYKAQIKELLIQIEELKQQ